MSIFLQMILIIRILQLFCKWSISSWLVVSLQCDLQIIRKIGGPGARVLFFVKDPAKKTAWCDSHCVTVFCKWSGKNDSLVWQFFANVLEHLDVLVSCKKRCFGAKTFVANYEQHQFGPASCHAIADGNVFANDHPDGPAACRKDVLPGQFFCILITFVRSLRNLLLGRGERVAGTNS